jgi:hypothetical protein
MTVPQRIPVRFEDVFRHGAFVLGVEPINDFENTPHLQEALVAQVARLRGEAGNEAA